MVALKLELYSNIHTSVIIVALSCDKLLHHAQENERITAYTRRYPTAVSVQCMLVDRTST